MKGLQFLNLLLMLMVLSSCSTKTKKPIIEQVGYQTVEKKNYTIDIEGATLQWTAYKFTNKARVFGSFNEYEVEMASTTPSLIEDQLRGAKITIATSSVNSSLALRDAKISNFFFKVFNTDTIKGELLTANRKNGLLSLEMNTMTNDVGYTYELKNDTLVMHTKINLENWDGTEALASLNQECYQLHMGTDGISKLWPEVAIVLKLPIKEMPDAD